MLKIKALLSLSAVLVLSSHLHADDLFAVREEKFIDRTEYHNSEHFLSDELLRSFGAKRMDEGSGGDESHFIIRVTVLRSLDAPLMFTWHIKDKDESSELKIQRLKVTYSDTNGKEYHGVDFSKAISIPPNQGRLLRSVFHASNINSLPQSDWQKAGLDGSRWIYEVAVHDSSIVLERNNPIGLNEATFELFKVSMIRKEQESNLTAFALMLWLLSELDDKPY
jgi:hypothetical protein